MRVQCKFSSISLLIILLLGLFFVGLNTAFAQTNQGNSKLQEANIAVNQAYSAVLDAEKAGANVTNLILRLNYALEILAQAENSYRTGSTDTAATQADNVFPIAQQIKTTAQNIKQDALISSQNNFWWTIVFTLVSTIIFLEALILFWLWFKRRYIKNLSEAKPEVVNTET